MGLFNSDTSDTSGLTLLEKWKQQRIARKIQRKEDYIKENTQPTFFDKAWDMITSNWILVVIIGLVFWFVIKPLMFGGKKIFRRKKKVNSGRSFYLRMQRAKARKRRK